MPVAVGFPRNHTDAPLKAGAEAIIGIHEEADPVAVITSPWALSGSAFTTLMLTRAPFCTVTVGSTMPAMRNVSSGPPEGLARTIRLAECPEKVTCLVWVSSVAPAGTTLLSRVASVELTRVPGASAKRRPMTSPGSLLDPIIPLGSDPPFIHPGAFVPPIIHP